MFLSRNLVFVELHKTGCTHIGKLLAQFVGGYQIGKHNPAPIELLGSGRKFIGSIRNPWDWYVSLWAFGCGKQGSVYEHTMAPLTLAAAGPDTPTRSAPVAPPPKAAIKRARAWQQCYSDARSVTAFRDWLHMMHDPAYWNDFGEGYGSSSLNHFAGLLTYRYMYLFCRFTQMAFPSLDSLREYERRCRYIDFFIRTEYLETDFVEALRLAGAPVTDAQCRAIGAMGKTNASSGRLETALYYDEESARIVFERERLIVDKFSYSIPTE